MQDSSRLDLNRLRDLVESESERLRLLSEAAQENFNEMQHKIEKQRRLVEQLRQELRKRKGKAQGSGE